MMVDKWLPIYREILKYFGYREEEDRKAAEILDGLIEKHDTVGPDNLEKLLKGRRVLIIGAANVSKNEIKDFDTVIVADGGIKNAEILGLRADIIVTDLDAPSDALEMEFHMNANGTILIIHAHGDNIQALEKFLPRLKGPIMGTTQTVPLGRLHNFGGFTDGDRAVLMAAHLGAKEIALIGFDFKNPVFKKGRDTEIKREKLKWAERMITMVHPQPYILPRN